MPDCPLYVEREGNLTQDAVGRGRSSCPEIIESVGELDRRATIKTVQTPDSRWGRAREPELRKAGVKPSRTRVKVMSQSAMVVGIDVSKRSLEVATDTESFRVGNDEEGLRELIARLVPLRPELVVLEASGGYEKAAWLGLWSAGIKVARINPRDAYHFAQACRQLAKTDRLDAQGLRRFGEQLQPPPTPVPSAADQELQELVHRRQQLVSLITAERNRQQQTRNSTIRGSIGRTLRNLQREKGAIEHAIEQRLEQQPSKRVALLESRPGVGRVTSAILIARLPELGTLSAREVAALVGVAPFTRQSGQWRGQSHIFGGRADLRCALYMAAHNAVRCEGPLRDFFQRLRAAGKSRLVALTACIRKLIVILNAMVKHNAHWSPQCLTHA
jgi:transposase